jgi:hypothetical protein
MGMALSVVECESLSSPGLALMQHGSGVAKLERVLHGECEDVIGHRQGGCPSPRIGPQQEVACCTRGGAAACNENDAQLRGGNLGSFGYGRVMPRPSSFTSMRMRGEERSISDI